MTSHRDINGFLPLPAIDLQLLLSLCRSDNHAYGLSKEAEQDNENPVRLGVGSLYRVLARMLEAGWIDELPPDPDARGHAAKRKNYRITELGREVARAEVLRLRRVVETAAEHDLVRLRWSGRG
jgi:DNA-binding PadR family transcriptional regulator